MIYDTNSIITLLENLKKKINDHEKIFIKVISGKYKGSILKLSNVSVKYNSVQSYQLPLNRLLSFTYTQVEFLEGDNFNENIILNTTSTDTKSITDRLGNILSSGDYVAFVSTIHSKKECLQFGILEITNNKSVRVKLIPLEEGEKSVIINSPWRANLLKLSEDQIKQLFSLKLST